MIDPKLLDALRNAKTQKRREEIQKLIQESLYNGAK